MKGMPRYNEKTPLFRSEYRPSSSASSEGGLYPDLTSHFAGRHHPTRHVQPNKRRDCQWEGPTNPLVKICSLTVFITFLLFSGVLSLILVVGLHHADPPYVRKVAIIGGGPAGASAAYNIRKYVRRHGILVKITIFERDSHIGGRSTRHIPLDDGDTVQVAATGFRGSDKMLNDLTTELGHKRIRLDEHPDTDLSGRSGDRWGVFDGGSIVFRQAHPTNFLTGWWWNLKLFFYYGYSPQNAKNAIQETSSKLSHIYTKFFPFTSLAEVAKDLELEDAIKNTGSQLLSAHKVGTGFQKDLFNSWVRRDFAQNLGTISGLAAMTSPDNGGDLTIQGGHWTLFETMIATSKADLRLNTSVFGLRRMEWGGWVVASQPTDGGDDPSGEDYSEFDTVILTAPWESSGLEIKGEPLENVPSGSEYAELHITLFKSPRKLSGKYFHYNGEVPETLLTTLRGNEFGDLKSRTGVEGVGSVGFYEIKSVKRSDRVDMMGVVIEEWLYKLVSPAKIEDATIKAMLGARENEDGIISWISRLEWPMAIPYVYPKTQDTPLPPLELSPNFYYTSAIESFGSTMEFSSMMGANIATLIVNEWSKEGRGKRPARSFSEPLEEASRDTSSLWPETAYSWGRSVYEGIWENSSHESGQADGELPIGSEETQ